MSEFNFGSFSTTSAVSTSKSQLKPYNTYKVKYAGAKVEHIAGKKDPSKVWDILKIRFEGEEGYYEESVFFLTPEDKNRPEYENREGHKYNKPSRFENTMMLLIQLITVLNEESAKKFQAILPKCKSFDDVATSFIKVLEKEQNKELYIKLLGRNNNGSVYAALPACCGLKDDELFPVNVFSLKDDFKWTSYELQKQSEYQNAKPTKMESAPATDDIVGVPTSGSEDEIDFEKLL